METVENLRKQLQEVNRDIEGMLTDGIMSEKSAKVLKDAREYRATLEDDLLTEVRKSINNGQTDKPEIVGIIIVNLI